RARQQSPRRADGRRDARCMDRGGDREVEGHTAAAAVGRPCCRADHPRAPRERAPGAGMTLPTFSILMETSNLRLAHVERLRAALASIAAQDPSPSEAEE